MIKLFLLKVLLFNCQMHTGFISFCDRINFNIKSTDTKTKILEDLKKFNIQILEKHWYKLDEKNVEHMQRIPHLACLRSNGNPYYMYFTKYEDVPIIYFIDKKIYIYFSTWNNRAIYQYKINRLFFLNIVYSNY